MTDGVLTQQGSQYVFTRDTLFSSPSMAAIAVLGRSANGWIEWKTEQGQTLDGAKRQAVQAADLFCCIVDSCLRLFHGR